MSDLLDEGKLMEQRRGSTLKVLAILSWVYIGLSVLGILIAVIDGPLSPDELEMEKAALLESMTPEVVKILGEDFFAESIMVMEVTNEYFWSMQGLNLVTMVLGFYGVFLMFQLKKVGFYYYLAYSILPVIVSVSFFGMGKLMIFGLVFSVIISGVFCILYGLQTKRMS